VLTWLGYNAGQRWESLHVWLHKADLGVVAILVLGIGFWLYHHLAPEHRPAAADAEPAKSTVGDDR